MTTALITSGGAETYPISATDAKPVPDNRIIDADLLTEDTGRVPVVITRDRGTHGAACSWRLAVDDKSVASLRASEKLVLYLEPGEYVLAASVKGMCLNGSAKMRLHVETGNPLRIRVGAGYPSGKLIIEPTAL